MLQCGKRNIKKIHVNKAHRKTHANANEINELSSYVLFEKTCNDFFNKEPKYVEIWSKPYKH